MSPGQLVTLYKIGKPKTYIHTKLRDVIQEIAVEVTKRLGY